MNIKDLMVREVMIIGLQVTDKKGAINEMVQRMFDAGRISDIEAYREGTLAREAQTSTGLGGGVAMPHVKNSTVKKATVLFAKSQKGVDYETLDGQPTYLFFMIVAPEGANDTHLQALAALSRLLIGADFVRKLKEANTPEEVQGLFQTAEGQKEAEEKAKQETQAAEASAHPERKFVVAVTACPVGIARTYMAGDALKRKAREMGMEIKVETNGSEGIKNRLTAEDIARTEGVIVAADKKVEMNRFDGKELINRPVSDGIRKPEELINLALNGTTPVFHGGGKEDSSEEGNADGAIGQRIYKDLMSGVSHVLPFVIGGGIAIALSSMIDQFVGVPHDQLSNLGNYNQAASWFNQIRQAAFGFMLPALTGFIVSSIGDRPGLIVRFAAGALANTGDAGFLSVLIGGFLAGYVIIFLRKSFKNLPKSLDGIRTILFYPMFGLLVTGFLMLLVNVPMKAINDALNDFLTSVSGSNVALPGALLAGMMAANLGGPINKVAHVLGTATLATIVATDGSVAMASVMAGGVVPPLAIFVATRLFKNKFSKTDQDAGLTNIVMGLSFVTEGSIPFAAADPIRAISSFTIGSALTGGLVGAFGIKLLAPHGGIFVVFLLSHPVMYLVFIATGAVVSGVIYGLLRKASAVAEA